MKNKKRKTRSRLNFKAAVRAAYEPGNGVTSGEQMWGGKWWRPVWGCDTLEVLLDAVERRTLNE